jgi:hypothetical protein
MDQYWIDRINEWREAYYKEHEALVKAQQKIKELEERQARIEKQLKENLDLLEAIRKRV